MGTHTPRLLESITAVSAYWIPACAGTTTEYDAAISRHGLPELCIWFALQELRGRREDRVRAAPAVPCARSGGDAHTSIQVRRKHPGLPCAMALRLTSCSPRSGRARCHRRPREAFASPGLDASIGASGPHDFAVRLRRATSLAPSASIASHRAFVTFASAPRIAARRAELCR